ncbi:MAG: gliding motility-associated C-terminal domain-containing protein, partial [Bacteroidetes bacterium]|nr:gliding motility-associated C-terminal domain-containing protein [Bacteroidota bacterium]
KSLRDPGIYSVKHVVSNNGLCADTFFMQDSIVVNGTVAKLNVQDNSGCEGHSTMFWADISQDFPGGSTTPNFIWKMKPRKGITITDSLNDTVHIQFDSAGRYAVTVDIVNSKGCINSLTETLNIGAVANWGWDDDSLQRVCLNQPMKLYDSSFINANAHKWSISPATAGYFVPNDSSRDVSIVFTQSGTHTVQMILYSDSLGTCSDTMRHNLTVTAPEAKFKVDKPFSLCSPQILKFTNESKNADGFEWNYDDGETSNIGATEHSYVYIKNNNTGFSPYLVATKLGGCPDTFVLTRGIRIIGPEPKFAIDTTVGCDSLTVSFTNLSKPLNAEFYIDYGDGSLPDTNKVNDHKYQYAQTSNSDSITYYPTIVASQNGCSSFYTDSIKLYKKPIARFGLDTAIGCSPLRVEFFNQSASVYSTIWDFDGDNVNDSFDNDTAIFNYTTGVYSPRLVVQYKGLCSDTAILDSGIKSLAIPTARLTLSTRRGCDSLQVDFTANNPGDSFIIEYGNGLSDTNTTQTILYGFNAANAIGDSTTYVVKYFVTSPALNSCSDTLWDTVRVYRQPAASFTVDTLEGCAPLKVQYVNTSQNHDVNIWDMNQDGTPDFINQDTVTQIYGQGQYTITLGIATNIGCGDTISSLQPVVVRNIPTPQLQISKFADCTPVSVSFTPNNAQDSFVIDYGSIFGPDTNKTSDKIYPFAGTLAEDSFNYRWSYRVYDRVLSYCADTLNDSNIIAGKWRPITAYPIPNANFSIDTNEGCSPLKVEFFNQSDRNDKLYWDLNNDGTTNAINLDTTNFTYTKGYYGAKLVSETNFGCSDTLEIDSIIRVEDIPVPIFSTNTNAGCDSLNVSFGVNNPTDSFIMNYGNGNVSTNTVNNQRYGFDITNALGDSTTYNLVYVVFNKKMPYCTDTVFSSVAVYRQPVANFKESINYGCEPLQVTFSNGSQGQDNHIWYIDSFSNLTADIDTITTSFNAGKYSIGIAVSSLNGCVDTLIKTDLIHALKSPDISFSSKPDTTCNGGFIQFNDGSKVDTNIFTRTWTFDPRGTSVSGEILNVPRPLVAFTSTNKYDSFLVTLEISDSNFCTSRDSAYVYTLESETPDTMAIVGVSFQEPIGSKKGIRFQWNKQFEDDIELLELIKVADGDTSLLYSGIPLSSNVYFDNNAKDPVNEIATYYINVADSCGKNSGFTSLPATYPILSGGNTGEQSVTLTWKDQQSAFATNQIIILRSKKPQGPFTILDSVNAGINTYTDTTLYCNSKYYYAIQCRNKAGLMASNVVIGTGKFVPPTGSPLMLNTTVSNNLHISFNWTKSNQPGLKQYLIDKKTSTSGWVINYDSSAVNSFTDSLQQIDSVIYHYRVRTIDVCGFQSGRSNEGNSILLETKQGEISIHLSWNNFGTWSNVPFHYEVQLKKANNGFETIATLASNVTSYEDVGAYFDADQGWCYRIVAVQDAGSEYASLSNEICFDAQAELVIPNAFTPNNDGLNEAYFVYSDAIKPATEDIETFNMKIYDRWGERIFESNSPHNYWDGTKNGNLVPVGRYMVVINAIKRNGEEINYSGIIMVLK